MEGKRLGRGGGGGRGQRVHSVVCATESEFVSVQLQTSAGGAEFVAGHRACVCNCAEGGRAATYSCHRKAVSACLVGRIPGSRMCCNNEYQAVPASDLAPPAFPRNSCTGLCCWD